jgi:hypothetical protein
VQDAPARSTAQLDAEGLAMTRCANRTAAPQKQKAARNLQGWGQRVFAAACVARCGTDSWRNPTALRSSVFSRGVLCLRIERHPACGNNSRQIASSSVTTLGHSIVPFLCKPGDAKCTPFLSRPHQELVQLPQHHLLSVCGTVGHVISKSFSPLVALITPFCRW